MLVNQTRIKNIPQDWKILTMAALSSVPISNGLYKSKEYYGKGPYMVHMAEIFAYDLIENNDMPRVNLSEKEKDKYLLQPGDLLFARRSLKPEGAGDVSIYFSENETSYESSIIRVRLNKTKACPLFVFYYLKSEFGKSQMMALVRQVAVSGITGEDLKKYQIPIPPVSEQQAIATTFQTWDMAIEKTEALIAVKEHQFDWLMKYLMSHSNKNWSSSTLKNVTQIKKGQQINRNTLTESGEYPVWNGGITPSGYTDKYNTDENITTISEGGNSCGFVNFSKEKFWLGGHCYALEKVNPEIFPSFLFFSLKSQEHHIMRLRVGSGLPNIQRKDIEKIEIKYPNFQQQKRIAEILNIAQKEINLLRELAQQYRTQKQSLVQKLLSGEWHIKHKEIP